MFGAVATLVFGLFASWVGLRVHRAIHATRHWQTVPGAILERDVAKMSTGRSAYCPVVKYAYEVGGKRYTNDTVYVIGRVGGGGERRMRRFVDQLPDPIPVHYDPNDPARSYLLRNPRWISFVIFVFAAGATFVGLVRVIDLLTSPGSGP